MTGSPSEHQAAINPVRRVLIGFGGAGASTEAFDVASELAAALQAEIAGLFVEEELLYQVSQLPISGMIGPHGKVMRGLDRDLIGRVIAARAQACRRALSQTAKRSHLHWSFEIERGEVMSVIGTRVRSDDILLVIGTAASTTPRAKMELAAQLGSASGANLVFPDSLRRRSGPVAVLHPERGKHLDLARRIAESLGERLIVILSQEPNENRQRRAPALRQSSPAKTVLVHSVQIEPVLSGLRPRLVVASHSDDVFAEAAAAGGLLRAAGAPILLVNS